MKITYCILFVLISAIMLWSGTGSVLHAEPTDVLNQHVNTFIDNQYPGVMSCTISKHEIVSTASDLDALADLMTLNWHVVDQTTDEFVEITGSNTERQQYIDEIIKPEMVIGALVAQLDWTLSGASITEYALVHPDATVGDTTKILDGVIGWCIIDPPSVNYDYENPFGMHVAHFEASINCEGGLCIPHRYQWTSLPGDNALGKHRVWCCQEAQMCVMDVAFVGYTGFPSVTFDVDKYAFEVSGFGWQWHNSYDRLTCPCNCIPAPGALVLGALGLGTAVSVLRRRKALR